VIAPLKTPTHDDRAAALDSLAVLMGFTTRLPYLPDGHQPDVLRLSIASRGLFIGDAKDTESPGNSATAARLSRYVDWAAVHARRFDGPTLLMLCFGVRQHAVGWLALVADLIRSRALEPKFGVEDLGGSFLVAWFIVEVEDP
jgi:hypothetical protein